MSTHSFKKFFRMIEFFLIAVVMSIIIQHVAPEQINVLIYKLAVIAGSGYFGYLVYAGAHSDGTRVSDENDTKMQIASMYCRAAFVIGFALAGAWTV